jgi:hypothetical protein
MPMTIKEEFSINLAQLVGSVKSCVSTIDSARKYYYAAYAISGSLKKDLIRSGFISIAAM